MEVKMIGPFQDSLGLHKYSSEYYLIYSDKKPLILGNFQIQNGVYVRSDRLYMDSDPKNIADWLNRFESVKRDYQFKLHQLGTDGCLEISHPVEKLVSVDEVTLDELIGNIKTRNQAIKDARENLEKLFV